MIKVLLPLIAALLIASCDNSPATKMGSDDYYFEDKEYTLIDQKYTFIVVPNKEEWDALADKYVGIPGKDLGAFSRLRLNRASPTLEGSECIVYIRDPNWMYEPEFIGHEIIHCLYGRWHPNQRGKG